MVDGAIDLSANAAPPRRRRRHDHIVDRLIAERAPKLAGGWAWPLLRPVLYRILDYAKARRLARAIAPMSGADALAYVSALLQVRVSVSGLDRVPRTGRVVMICNHPTGIADGIAVHDALKRVRPDMMFYANSDAHRVAPRFDTLPADAVEATAAMKAFVEHALPRDPDRRFS